jgi:hypothetical protein
LPKTHKKYDTLPNFRPIINTTNTPHYNVGTFLLCLLNPLTLNDYSLSDSFDTVTHIKKPKTSQKHEFEQGYQFVSFDVVSLFTNFPISCTVKIILDHIYNEKLLDTTLKKCTLKKLICQSKKMVRFE